MTHSINNHSTANNAALQRRHDAEARALAAKRTLYIKAIKTKQRQLGLDDADYRAMLMARTGKLSATACSLTELGNVSGYLTAQGAVNPRAGARTLTRRPVIAKDRQALRGKVTMLLADLVDEAGITDSVAYVNAICSKNGWCSAVDFADVHILHKLVGALSRTLTAKRAKARQAAAAQPARV